MPAVVVSHIMLEAYKKYVLIWLIYHGDKTQDALTFPKYTSPVVSKYIKPLCAPYHEVIKAFYSRYVFGSSINNGAFKNYVDKMR